MVLGTPNELIGITMGPTRRQGRKRVNSVHVQLAPCDDKEKESNYQREHKGGALHQDGLITKPSVRFGIDIYEIGDDSEASDGCKGVLEGEGEKVVMDQVVDNSVSNFVVGPLVFRGGLLEWSGGPTDNVGSQGGMNPVA
ncbi:hypothetical protein Ancab_013202 [Ancistrocladus abbreviatus]